VSKKVSQMVDTGGEIYASFGLKSAVGKSTLIKCAADLMDVTGQSWSGVSVDRSERLPDRYPEKFVRVNLPTDLEGRLDPYARTRAFAPLDEEVERLAKAGGVALFDIGSGEYPGAVLEHASRSRLNSLLKRSAISFTAFVVATNDAVMMADLPRLAGAVLQVLPDARVVIVLNQKTGVFQFSSSSAAQKVWLRDVEPLLAKFPSITIPAMPPGTWDPYEDRGLRFSEVALLEPEKNVADEKKLIAWTREPRGLAVVRQGDVAEWLHGAWQELSKVMHRHVVDGGDHAA
jgi:hypothetical protein